MSSPIFILVCGGGLSKKQIPTPKPCIAFFWGWKGCYVGSRIDRRLLNQDFALVKELAFADMGTMTNMHLSGRAVLAQGHWIELVVCPSLGTALLGVPAFGIWHYLLFMYS